jgi:hypothetical protein
LAAVDEELASRVVDALGDLPDRKRASVEVGGMEDADESRRWSQHGLEPVPLPSPGVRELQRLHMYAALAGQTLPQDEVRVVLLVGHDDAVPSLPIEPGTHDIDRLRRVANEDDPVPIGRPEEPGERVPRSLEAVTDLLSEPVEAPPRATGELAIVLLHRPEHGVRDQRHARGIEVRRRGLGAPLTEGREVLARALEVRHVSPAGAPRPPRRGPPPR